MRRFEGPTVRAALRQVERELGPGALIVKTEPVAGGFVVVAIPGARRPAPTAAPTPALARLAERGRSFGLSATLVDRLVAAAARAAPPADQAREVTSALAAFLAAQPRPRAPRLTALIGPTGVGKTTTAAKLAARCADAGQPIALISLDLARPGATEPLRALATDIGAAFGTARTAGELARLVASRGEPMLVDTAGCAPRDGRALRTAAAALRGATVAPVLCLPATARRQDAVAFLDAWSGPPPIAAVVTKWDETTMPGEVIELLADRRLPITHIGIGQRIREDLVDADPDRIAACALGLPPAVVTESTRSNR